MSFHLYSSSADCPVAAKVASFMATRDAQLTDERPAGGGGCCASWPFNRHDAGVANAPDCLERRRLLLQFTTCPGPSPFFWWVEGHPPGCSYRMRGV